MTDAVLKQFFILLLLIELIKAFLTPLTPLLFEVSMTPVISEITMVPEVPKVTSLVQYRDRL